MHQTIGLLGGSFNPIHYGHLAMAEAAKRELTLDRIILMTAGDPPHKSLELADKHDRLRMVKLAAEGRYEASSLEVDRPGKTFTVDTLTALHALYPGSEIFLVIGADTLTEIKNWREPAKVLSLCKIALFSRSDLPPMQAAPGQDFVMLQTSIPRISSTCIRKRIHKGLSVDGMTPQCVVDYIGRHRLYSPPKSMPKREIQKRLRVELPQERFRHVLGVETTIMALAKRWGYDVDRAGLAGLLHDCAKGMKLGEMLAFVQKQGDVVDPGRTLSKALLHAPASAAMARSRYGVTDPEVFHAIWFHNTGAIQMSLLDKLLYVADMTEPTRKCDPWIEPLRHLSMEDLDEAVLMAMRVKLDFIEKRGKEAHPDTAAAFYAMENHLKRERML